MNSIKLQVKIRGQKYSILIGSNILHNLKNLLKKNFIIYNKCLIVVDKNVQIGRAHV